MDFGDAPAGYPVTLAEDGARHGTAMPLRLGATRNIEPDGTFKIGTNSADDGLPLGEYEVAVMEHRVTPEGAAPPPAKLDLRFSALKTSGLKVTIKGGTNPVTLTLGHPAKK